MHNADRAGRIPVLLLFFIALAFSPAFPQNAKAPFSVRVLQPGIAELKPLDRKTWTFRVTNQSQDSLDLETEAVLPPGWTAITPARSFSLASEMSSIQMLAISVPMKAEAQDYTLLFRVRSRRSPQIYLETRLTLRVSLVTEIKIESVELPSMVVAGDSYTALYRLTNLSNAPSVLILSCLSDSNTSVFVKESEIKLAPGESRPITLDVETSSDIRWNIRHRLKLIAEAHYVTGERADDTAVRFVDVIPSVSGEDKIYHRLPMEISMVGMQGAAHILQAGISGSRTLRDSGSGRVEFMVRGPRQEDLQQFGYTHESLKLKFHSALGEVSFGDKVFSLSKMTEYGIYGRGIEGRINLKSFTLSAYSQRSYFQNPDSNQRAFQMSYSPDPDDLSFGLNYLENRGEMKVRDRIMSLSARLSLSSLFVSRLEIARGSHRNDGQESTSGQAFWMETMGRWNRSGYRLSLIESSRGFPGKYRNLGFRSSSISCVVLKNFALKASYHEMVRRPKDSPFSEGGKERSYQAGLNYKLAKSLNISIAYRARDRRLSQTAGTVDYIDRMLRIGISPRLNNLNLHAVVDIGNTHNRITGEHQRLLELNVSGTATIFKRLTLSGTYQARNQEDGFTGDYERGNNISLRAALNLKKTKISAYYRSSLYQEFYERILFDRELVQDMLFSQMTFFEFSIRKTLKNRHSLTFRVRRAAGYDSLDSRGRLIGLIEYKIPIGIPVSRLSDRGSLAGRIVNPSKIGIAGAVIELNQMSTLTDREGRFFFYSVKPGDYLVKIKHGTLPEGMICLKPLPLKVNITAKQRRSLELPVTRGASIRGYVFLFKVQGQAQRILRNRNTAEKVLTKDKALEGIVVEIRGETGIHFRQTDRKGYFNFGGLAPGEWKIRAYTDRLPELHIFEEEEKTVDLEAGDRLELLFKVVPKKKEIRIIQTGMVGTSSTADEKHILLPEQNRQSTNLMNTPMQNPRSIILPEYLKP